MPSFIPLSRVSSIAILLATLAATGSAQTPVPTSQADTPLTLSDCVQRALARNFDIGLGHYDTANAAADVSIARSGFDPVFNASSTRSGSRLEGASRATNGWNNRMGLSQHVVTGADISLSTGLDRPFGMLVLNGKFYIADTGSVQVFPYQDAQTHITGKAK